MPRLHDGRDVDSSSGDWRLHCEARRLLQLDGYRRVGTDGRWTVVSPRRHRQQYLEGVLAARGPVLPAGVAITLPEVQRPASERNGVALWD